MKDLYAKGFRERLRKIIGILGNKNLDYGKRTEFAKKIDVGQANVNSWIEEKRAKIPSIYIAAKIAENYDVDLNWLITGKGKEYKNPTIYDDLEKTSKEIELLKEKFNILETLYKKTEEH